MNIKSLAFLCLLVTLTLTNCFEDRDDSPAETKSINDFVWKTMNLVYLYKNNVPDLADDKFSSNEAYSNYLAGYPTPETLFESLIYQPETVDRFSIIVNDYIALEQRFKGVFKTNGMEFSLYTAPNSTSDLVGVVLLVLNGSDAEAKGVKRGDLFGQVDGVSITKTNASELFAQDSYTINLSTYNDNGTSETTDDTIVPNGTNIALHKIEFTENPIYITKVFQVGGQQVGYIMYNGFTSGSENDLNAVFANFKSLNVNQLILDLRYNPGGSVATTTYLASMITGQFTGQVFETLIYNENLQQFNQDYLFSNTVNGNALNSLGLSKIYVLTTNRSASASEGLINGLSPYINVIQIGTETTGKTQASRTFYDSPDLSRQGANPAHTYALQPLIANGVNKNMKTVPSTGLPPSNGYEYKETPLNLGILGNANEPLLALALADIQNTTGKSHTIKNKKPFLQHKVMDSNDFLPFEKGGMIAD